MTPTVHTSEKNGVRIFFTTDTHPNTPIHHTVTALTLD